MKRPERATIRREAATASDEPAPATSLTAPPDLDVDVLLADVAELALLTLGDEVAEDAPLVEPVPVVWLEEPVDKLAVFVMIC